MPLTRRQLAESHDNSPYEKISIRPDATLNNPHGIAGLPVSMFQEIQSYLTESDYRSFMNTSLTYFQRIKYETVYYTLISPDLWGKIGRRSREERKDFFDQFIACTVKDKSKQIGITIRASPQILLESFNLFQGLQKVSLTGKSYRMELDGRIFNNIHHVILNKFEKFRSTTIEEGEGFANVVKLELFDFSGLVRLEAGLNASKKMKKLVIKDCPLFEEILCPIAEIPFIEIDCPLFHSVKSKFGQHESLSITTTKLSTETMTNLNEAIAMVGNLRLNTELPTDLDSATMLPPCYGKRIFLRRCNLEQWNHPDYSPTFLISLQLTNCQNFHHLPIEMPSLQVLKLSNCKVQAIPSYTRLKTLEIQFCHQLTSIAVQPNLKSVDLKRCVNLYDLSFAGQTNTINSFTLQDCSKVKDLSHLSKIERVTIFGCYRIINVANLVNDGQLSSSSSPSGIKNRTIKLGYLPEVTDLTALHHIDTLILIGMDSLKNNRPIHDINHLKVGGCHNWKDSRNLSNINKSLTIRGCSNFTKLLNVEGIPEVDYKEYRPSRVMTPCRINETYGL